MPVQLTSGSTPAEASTARGGVTALLCTAGLLLGGATLELLSEVGRQRLVPVELHGEGGTTLGEGAQLANVAEHRRERDGGSDDLHVALLVHAVDHATTGVQVTNDATHVVLWRGDLDLHDGLRDHWLAALRALLEARAAGNLEGHDGGVHGVEGAIGQLDLDINHRVAGNDTIQHLRLDALLDTRNVLLRDGSAGDLVHELEALVTVRLKDQLDLGILAGAAGLLLVGVPELGAGGDGLAVRHLRSADLGIHLELALQAVDDDLEVQLTHALDDGLVRLLITAEAEGGVLGGKLGERLDHLVGVGLRRGLAGDLDHRLGEVHL